MLLLAIAFLLLPGTAQASSQVTCACEWSPWTRVNYLSCAELRLDGSSNSVVSQQPFNREGDCKSEAARVQESAPKRSRGPASVEPPNEVSCECDWNPWRMNFLLSCTAWFEDAPAVRMVDRMPFGSPKGRRGESEKSCFAAKSSIETFARDSR